MVTLTASPAETRPELDFWALVNSLETSLCSLSDTVLTSNCRADSSGSHVCCLIPSACTYPSLQLSTINNFSKLSNIRLPLLGTPHVAQIHFPPLSVIFSCPRMLTILACSWETLLPLGFVQQDNRQECEREKVRLGFCSPVLPHRLWVGSCHASPATI